MKKPVIVNQTATKMPAAIFREGKKLASDILDKSLENTNHGMAIVQAGGVAMGALEWIRRHAQGEHEQLRTFLQNMLKELDR